MRYLLAVAPDHAERVELGASFLGDVAQALAVIGAGGGSVREQISHIRTHVDRQLARAHSHGTSVAGGTYTDVTRTIDPLLGLYGATLTITRAPDGGCRAAFTIQGSVGAGVVPVGARAPVGLSRAERVHRPPTRHPSPPFHRTQGMK